MKNRMAVKLLWCALLFNFLTWPAAGTPKNLVLGISYTIDAPPNYATARVDSGTLLTDGSSGRGAFWRNSSSLGWMLRSPTLLFKLRQSATLDHVRISAGSSPSTEIFVPSYMAVYGGDGTAGYQFLGAAPLHRDVDNSKTNEMYDVEVAVSARSVKEVVVVTLARGAYVFLSEVEVFGSEGDAGQTSALRPNLASLEMVKGDARERRRQAIARLPGAPTGPDIARRWSLPLAAVKPAGPSSRSSAEAGSDCLIERIEPWSDQMGREETISPSAPLVMLAGGMDTAAFRLTNRSPQGAAARLATQSNSPVAVRTYALAHVQALSYAWIPDVLAPFDAGDVAAGSQMILLAQISSGEAGAGRVDIAVSCGGRTQFFDVPLRVVADDPAVPPLHGNLWAYVHQRSHAPVAGALACDKDFLNRYGADTAVVHPSALIGKEGERPTELLTRYLRDYRKAKRILLFMNVKLPLWKFKVMNDEAAVEWFRNWWLWVEDVARQSGTTGELVLYPIDEPDLSDIPLLLRTLSVLRRAGVMARSYATVGAKSALLLRSLDILQFHRPNVLWKTMLGGVSLESYDTRHDARLQSVNNYYRRQGWQAYQLGLDGVGIWSLWDSIGASDPASGWSPFLEEREKDWGMLYLGPDGCGWPSRRLAAFQRGVEENRILRLCTRRLGANMVDRQVAKVLEEPADAQKVRRELMTIVDTCN